MPTKLFRLSSFALLLAMLLSVAMVAGLGYWDAGRESAAALREFAQEQALLARSLAARLSATGPAGLRDLARPDAPYPLVVLLLPPGQDRFLAPDGSTREAAPLLDGVHRGRSVVEVPRELAPRLGLPQRLALAGLAPVAGGEWHVAAVASALRVRDRERRALWRLIFAVLLGSGLVLAFGGLALHEQRRELLLARELALSDLARERDERLLRASRAATMGTLAMGITHELSTPLGIIAGRAEQLLPRVRAAGDERAERGVRSILEQAERMNQVIRGFLGLARGGAPAIEPLRPAELVKEAVALVEHRFRHAGVLLFAEVDEGLPALRGDARLLGQALVNLLLNACDACAGGGEVLLRAQAAGPALRFAVEDDGAGISAQDAARALEPFFTTKPASAGSGLGLAVANEIVKSHRGTLTLSPRAPRGTAAVIELPLPQDDAHDG